MKIKIINRKIVLLKILYILTKMNKDYTLCFYRSDAKIGCNKVDLEPEKAKTKMTINRGFQTITATCHNYHIKSLGCD